jgi:hypothetical protein
MRNLTIYLTGFLCLFLTNLFGQGTSDSELSKQTFESRAKAIAAKIETITKEEKAALKTEIELVNSQLESGTLSPAQAEEQKLKLADTRAKNIETRVASAEAELKNLVQEKVDGKIKEQDSTKNKFMISFDNKKAKDRDKNGEPRTTSQFVFALGANNLMTGNSLANSNYRYWGSHFYEWGVTWNTRLLKNHNLLHAKYGVSVMYNNLRPTDDRYFQQYGNQTLLVKSTTDLRDSRFRNVYVVVPVHLEFDFSGKNVKDGKTTFQTHDSFRFGMGGFVGGNVKSKQILDYRDANGNKVRERTKGDYNVNDLIYGASAYIGYKEVSLYCKYDLSDLFRNSGVEQHNISMGVRFDLN